MEKMWAGRFAKELDAAANDFNSSIRFDSKMFREDIRGSMAHAAMLGAKGIIPTTSSEKIIETLGEILADLEEGTLDFDMNAEDIHMFIEAELTKRIGDIGKQLHTARSRNDQVALDLKMYMKTRTDEVIALVKELMEALLMLAKEHKGVIMPGYTHLQRAQPVTFGHHMMAYAMMFSRDIVRLKNAKALMNTSPLGSCALAGTTYDTDRDMVAAELGFDGVALNSLDGVSDRDYCVELSSCFAIIMMHLSRLCEEIIMWSSWEFKFIDLDDSYSTGSSIMPQKKNPDMAELIRGKTGRVYGDLMGILTVLKGIPLAYNKDMQEDKESIFDSVETVSACLSIATPMLATMRVNKGNMYRAASGGFINATDCADYLVKKGMPFRTAYKIVGQSVAMCIAEKTTLEELPLEKYKEMSELFDEDIYEAINLETCVAKRISKGGTNVASVEMQIEYIESFLKNS